jgi:hypothetical protein
VRLANGREGSTELLGCSRTDEVEFNRQRGSYRLEILHPLRVERRVWIPQNGDAGEPWDRPLSSCSRVVARSAIILESPVTLPSECARLATRPDRTGSPTLVMATEMVEVARLTAWVASVVSTTITSTLRWTRSVYNRSRRHSTLGYKSPTQFIHDWIVTQQDRYTAA